MYSPRCDKAAEYRRQAQEVRNLARQISINDARGQLRATAMHLEALAEEEERRAGNVAPAQGPAGED
ncbi:hypothetical protein DC522_12585 [Microvirga sp. KLBC 81]|uniref:hypothetical protein n=1 Tax=Microvirga sp. KLBC 81 TaxID=1862707 RepID=UPI000D50E5AF|nr:hypothetical protein [Microvirga sp. KLBC 81]PVE24120.1 hypothetical protein DC522_12585 [Microvirga sp. KLBC 81]